MNNPGPMSSSDIFQTTGGAACQGRDFSMNFDPTANALKMTLYAERIDLNNHPGMLETIATNPNTPLSVLRRLAFHTLPDIRAALAENCNTPLDTIYMLAADSDADVRYQIAENHHLPVTLLKMLADDDNPYVSCRALRTIERIEASAPKPKARWDLFRGTYSNSTSAVTKIRRLCARISQYARAI